MNTDYTELRARVEAKRPWTIELACITVLGLLDELERYKRLSPWLQCHPECNDQAYEGDCDCGFLAALNPAEVNE